MRIVFVVMSCIFFILSSMSEDVQANNPIASVSEYDVRFSEELRQQINEHRVPGDSLPRIVLAGGYQAFVYAAGLASPDGLAMNAEGTLFVAEESGNRVSRVSDDGTVTIFATGISSPEGIAFDSAGNLLVVEDIQNGRVLRFSPTGAMTVLATNRDAPEGVAVAPNGTVYITESTVQFVGSPFDYQTHVTRLPEGSSPVYLNNAIWFWSYSGIAVASAGMIYICNEASSVGTTDSVFRVDPATGIRTLFCSNLTACEGLSFSPGRAFPLYVVEEDLGSGNGRLSKVTASGVVSTFATGFYNIEDILLDSMGRIFVSEDTSGMIIRIEQIPSATPYITNTPTHIPTSSPAPTGTVNPAVPVSSFSSTVVILIVLGIYLTIYSRYAI